MAIAWQQLRDEYVEKPIQCPKCRQLATSVYKSGDKAFYNHSDPKAVYRNGKLSVIWKSCEEDRTESAT